MDIKTFSVGWTWLLFAVMTTLVLLLTSSCTDAAYLNPYIHDYQPLHFDAAHVRLKHGRVKRQIDDVLRWNFKAYGRTFKLQLKKDKSVFSPDHILDFGGMEYPTDTSFFYTGSLSDVPDSRAHMSVHDGHISGQVFVPGDTTYYIEPAAHFSGLKNATDFHTIIYPESRMDLDPFRHKRKGASTCGGGLHADLKSKYRPVEVNVEERQEKTDPYLKYSAERNSKPHYRHKRAVDELSSTSAKSCNMHLRADNLLYRHYLENKYGNNVEQAKDAILSLFASHITVLSQIYVATTFDNPSRGYTYNGINFILQRSTIMENCDGDVDDNYCRNTLDVTNYLHLTSEENHDAFCLVHTFTYRDFIDGVLGLAWVANANSPNSGFCGKYGRVSTDEGIENLSLNTGIVSFINYNEEVASKVSQITFAHEVGHNFGSEHDLTVECAPFGTSQQDASDGNYIMYAKATSGNLPNNRKFSTCSRSAIADVLYSVGGNRDNCFRESDEAFCGNKIVEDTEECDCGYENECDDQCCNGRSESANDCKRKTGVCSPSEGPCCTDSCGYKATNIMCAPSTSCTGSSNCNGSSAVCPPPQQQSTETFCNDYQAVCEEGECIGSVCLNIGWQECFKNVEDGAKEEELCYVACRETETSECISSADDVKLAENPVFKNLLDTIKGNSSSVTTGGVERAPGSPCDDYKGYCDVFSKCRSVDSEGPFKQLTDLIFNPVTFSNIRDWITDHWWAVLLMGIGVIVFMAVFVKIFGYNTPSENPKRKRQNRQAQQARAGRAQLQGNKRRQDKRAAPYTTETPMQEMPYRGAPHGGPYGGPHDGGAGPYFDNYGYEGREYYQPPPEYTASAPPPPRSAHQQYDRIHGQRY